MVKVSSESVRPDSVGVEFDDERLIAYGEIDPA